MQLDIHRCNMHVNKLKKNKAPIAIGKENRSLSILFLKKYHWFKFNKLISKENRILTDLFFKNP